MEEEVERLRGPINQSSHAEVDQASKPSWQSCCEITRRLATAPKVRRQVCIVDWDEGASQLHLQKQGQTGIWIGISFCHFFKGLLL